MFALCAALQKNNIMKCSKCKFEGGRDAWHFVGNASFTGLLASRKCPECGNIEVANEMEADEAYSGPQPWGMDKFRGRVFKGKKKL